MPSDIEVPSPTTEKPGDATSKGAGNLSLGQAAAQLFAQAEKAEQQKAQTATEQKPPETATETPPETPVAETAPIAASATTEEEAPPAETTEAEAKPEEEADTVHSQKISFTPEQQEIFNKRLGKEVAKTKAIESQMAEAKAKLAELEGKLAQTTQAAEQAKAPPPPVVVLGNQPLVEINDFATLQAKFQEAKSAVREIEETLDNPRAWKAQTVTDPATGDEVQIRVTTIGDKTYTESDLKGAMRRAKVVYEDQVPARAQFLTAKAQAQELAFKEFPFLKDKSSPEYQMAEAARRDPANAAIMAQPNADWIIGVQIEGMKAIEARKQAAKAPPPKPKPAPPPKPPSDQAVVSTSAAAPRQPIGVAERQAIANERARLNKKGGIKAEDAVKFLTQLESQKSR